MASKDRIQRLKDDTRCNILSASLEIVKEEGWPALSMRKIADKIEYTAPIIYEYFSNKDAILQELTRMGYLKLTKQMEEANNQLTDPAGQLETMLLTCWKFAFENKELYKIMYGVEVNCCAFEDICEVLKAPANMLREKIKELVPTDKKEDEQYIGIKYYTCWSVVHGLISINFTRKGITEEMNRQVLKDATASIINSIKDEAVNTGVSV